MSSGQKPSVGRIVHYRLSASDAKAIEERRKGGPTVAYESPMGTHHQRAFGGNGAIEGDVYPMVIVRVWSEHGVNGHVLLDGSDTFWATSRSEGEGPGTWSWPPRA